MNATNELPASDTATAPAAAAIPPVALLALLLCCGFGLLLPSPAKAQAACHITSSPHIAFGEVGSGGAGSSGTLAFTCNNSSGTPVTVTACVFMDPNQPPGVAPRRMVNWGTWPEAYLDYDLYADPAHTQVVGSQGSGHTVHYTTIQVEGAGPSNGWNPWTTGSLQLYAQLPAGQNVAAGSYVSQITPTLRYASSSGGTAPTEQQCATGTPVSNYSTVTANFANTCFISTATDLDFGNVADLSTSRDQISTIQLQCPTGTSWKVGLNDGIHAIGDTRRMAGPGGAHIVYELYRDGARSQRWGNTPDVDTRSGSGTGGIESLTVYGRVPLQSGVAAGQYADTITVTLTY